MLAAVCCGLAALCYAEFASTVPVSGSAYTFSYATIGELVAWIIGWDLLLEMMLGASVVAQGWASYFEDAARPARRHLARGPRVRRHVQPAGVPVGRDPDRPGRLRDQGVDAGQPRARGAQGLHRAVRHRRRHRLHRHRQLPALRAAGRARRRRPELAAHPAVPAGRPAAPQAYGVMGIIFAASLVFFAYIGFDVVATTAEEAANPQRDLPRGIIGSLVICTILYVAVSLVITGHGEVHRDRPGRRAGQRVRRRRARTATPRSSRPVPSPV